MKNEKKRKRGGKASDEKSVKDAAGVRVVGLGASAGGLEALKEFFAVMPASSGMAFVIVQHLEPTHESRMAEILAKSTAMKVIQADNGMQVEPDTVYTNPPGRALSIRDGRLILDQPAQRAHVAGVIDQFLTSLAEDQGPRAICIIFSGSSGSDGPRGLRAIRAAGGMCMAQEPPTAQFAAMPQAAIDTGLVDYVLPPGQMPAPLLEFAQYQQLPAADRGAPPAEEASTDTDLEAILKLLHTGAGSDYRHYKQNTIVRRIRRRMGLRQIGGMGEYAALLRQDATELTQLAKDMLIGVSSFFRDADAFEDLRTKVLAPLIEAKQDGVPLRAWVPGCATGEEAYSIAMLLLEAGSAAGKACPIQVFATDVDEQALATARAGTYPLSVEGDIPARLLTRFFTIQGQVYRVDKHLREVVVFSRHNVLTDPPFSKLDLISCRNVLIYLEPAAQKKVLGVFSFALNPGGHLLLGKSEGVAGMGNLLTPVSKQNRIYRLTRANRLAARELPPYFGCGPRGIIELERASRPEASILAQANMESILHHFNASVVLVDPTGGILYFHGRTEKYLGHPKGPASLNILDMTQGIFSAKLRRAMDQALRQGEPVSLPQVALPREDTPLVNLTVMPVAEDIGGGEAPCRHFSGRPTAAPRVARTRRLDRGRTPGGPVGGGGQGPAPRAALQCRGVRHDQRGIQGRQ